MKFQSRLRRRRRGKDAENTVTIYTKSVSGGYSETAAYTDINATREEIDGYALETDTGVVVLNVVVFWLEPVNGVLPTVNESQVLVYNSTRYDILQVKTLHFAERVKVVTRRPRSATG